MADDKRIIQYPEVESVNVSDYMMMDSASNGTTRYQVQRLLSQASAEAQNKVDAEAATRAAADTAIDERVTTNETDIAGLKTDLKTCPLVTDLNSATVNGMTYRFNAEATNKPGYNYGFVHAWQEGNNVIQIAITRGGLQPGTINVRSRNTAGTWGEWGSITISY